MRKTVARLNVRVGAAYFVDRYLSTWKVSSGPNALGSDIQRTPPYECAGRHVIAQRFIALSGTFPNLDTENGKKAWLINITLFVCGVIKKKETTLYSNLKYLSTADPPCRTSHPVLCCISPRYTRQAPEGGGG